MNDDAIISALQQQLDCYQRLAKLAKTQHEHVQNSRTEDLLLVLAQRQELLEQIAFFEQTIAPAKRDWQKYLASLAADQSELADSLREKTLQLLEQITTADREDSLVLQQRKFNAGRGINQAVAARKFNMNYAAAAYGPKKTSLDIQR